MAYRSTTAILLAALLSTSAVLGQTSRPARERFTAVAMDLGGLATSPATTAQVTITTPRGSSSAEQNRLLTAMREKKGAAVDVIRDQKPVGRIQFSSSLGYDLH